MISPSQLSFDSNKSSSSVLIQSKSWKEMIEVGSRICQMFGLPRSTGQIFGLLYLSTEPLSLNQMSSVLCISKGSASVGTRQLATWGAIRKVWIPGDRRDYYQVNEDLWQLIRNSYNNIIIPKIESSENRLNIINQKLNEDFSSGIISSDKKIILEGRIKALEKIQSRFKKIMSLTEKIIRQ